MSIDSVFTHERKFADEAALIKRISAEAGISEGQRKAISARSERLVEKIRNESNSSIMENFLAEYGLSTDEGVALMCLSEAMLRVPDADTIDTLIEDKIVPSDWGLHLGQASSSLINASTWALMVTGKVLDDAEPGIAGTIRSAIKRLGEPLIRTAVKRAMKEMGRQFVLGECIEDALVRAKSMESAGYTYSYDMLGEAATTQSDADDYRQSYSQAIDRLVDAAKSKEVAENPGISIKLSALHPRYEVLQEERVIRELCPLVLELAKKAKGANIGLNIDAEEQDKLVLSLRVIEQVLACPELKAWHGFGVVVQAYGKRAGQTIDWLYDLATRLDRKIMVRLVKGAYWDTEMKLAQVEGLENFALFTTKAATDVNYIAMAKKLFNYSDRIYPQFATHNAHTVSAVLELAENRPFEFQRLHGMGERLHDVVMKAHGSRCRIYAPVGVHSDLLAYLVRRLLENGANSSFVNQIVDEDVSAVEISLDPFETVRSAKPPRGLKMPNEIFEPKRRNSRGLDTSDFETLARLRSIKTLKLPFAEPIIARPTHGKPKPIYNPANENKIGEVIEASQDDVTNAINLGRPWSATNIERARTLHRAGDLFEENADLIFSALMQEAGKTLLDCIGELREAVDFLRYYATEAECKSLQPLGLVSAISPWNFPLAIFTGQVSAALAAGNGVLAKPAESTPTVAFIAVKLLHQAGVPKEALQLLPGLGRIVGAALTSDPHINGVVFTGSTQTAKTIRATMAKILDPSAPLIAETGGLNAMIVDSTALPEQAVRDIIASAFRSAGQRCSALRCLYVQEDIVENLTKMLIGAMDELVVGDPANFSTDVGPVVSDVAAQEILTYIEGAKVRGDVMHQVKSSGSGYFVPPSLIRVNGIDTLDREIFGPVLHLATFKSDDVDAVMESINRKGFGLTFGLHTRIDGRVQKVAEKMNVGNVYVNRNQIGAIVGSQPFGGEGLSGTGPKAGGPHYVSRFSKGSQPTGCEIKPWLEPCDIDQLAKNIGQRPKDGFVDKEELPGPTGETNVLSLVARGPILCMGPGEAAQNVQMDAVAELGGMPVGANGWIDPEVLTSLEGLHGVIWWGEDARELALALSRRAGPIVPLIGHLPDRVHVAHERHLCIDTTASGGNADLLAG